MEDIIPIGKYGLAACLGVLYTWGDVLVHYLSPVFLDHHGLMHPLKWRTDVLKWYVLCHETSDLAWFGSFVVFKRATVF